jgi:predicted Zn-dependent protease
VMSVETLSGRTGPFVITIDRQFIEELSREEVEAALAHELGHVWIYTHHPYVQTERLANDIAMRVVSRSAFEPVYEKVWSRTGIRGNLIEFLGPPSQH